MDLRRILLIVVGALLVALVVIIIIGSPFGESEPDATNVYATTTTQTTTDSVQAQLQRDRETARELIQSQNYPAGIRKFHEIYQSLPPGRERDVVLSEARKSWNEALAATPQPFITPVEQDHWLAQWPELGEGMPAEMDADAVEATEDPIDALMAEAESLISLGELDAATGSLNEAESLAPTEDQMTRIQVLRDQIAALSTPATETEDPVALAANAADDPAAASTSTESDTSAQTLASAQPTSPASSPQSSGGVSTPPPSSTPAPAASSTPQPPVQRQPPSTPSAPPRDTLGTRQPNRDVNRVAPAGSRPASTSSSRPSQARQQAVSGTRREYDHAEHIYQQLFVEDAPDLSDQSQQPATATPPQSQPGSTSTPAGNGSSLLMDD